jgi:hypothetical protein
MLLISDLWSLDAFSVTQMRIRSCLKSAARKAVLRLDPQPRETRGCDPLKSVQLDINGIHH